VIRARARAEAAEAEVLRLQGAAEEAAADLKGAAAALRGRDQEAARQQVVVSKTKCATFSGQVAGLIPGSGRVCLQRLPGWTDACMHWP
jgi:hypothetical protein